MTILCEPRLVSNGEATPLSFSEAHGKYPRDSCGCVEAIGAARVPEPYPENLPGRLVWKQSILRRDYTS